MESYIDKEKAKKSIALVLEKLKTDADLQALEEYRSVFKKEVSIFNRSWAAAFLLMNFDQGGMVIHGIRNKIPGNRKVQPEHRSIGCKLQSKAGANTDRAEEKNEETRPRQYTPLAEEESKRLFIGIGKKRRVFPREILGLIIAKAGVSREDIGVIRILDNYSFVQVRDSIADLVINSLDGFIFRGRTLAVNYAKARKDEENTDGSQEENPPREDSLISDNLADDEISEVPDIPEASDIPETSSQTENFNQTDNEGISEQGRD